jgi:hypothetical protein
MGGRFAAEFKTAKDTSSKPESNRQGRQFKTRVEQVQA